MSKTFTVQLGQFRADYVAYETRAPLSYDGFGTISLHLSHGEREELQRVRSGEPRWVLVRIEHEEWQVQRYASGFFTPVAFDSQLPHQKDHCPSLDETEQWITEELYKRLMGGVQ